MNPKNTWLWVLVAAGLFAFIFFFERHAHPPDSRPQKIFSALDPAAVTGVLVQPKGQLQIKAVHTNDSWQLTEPIQYPALTAGVETLLKVLQQLVPATRISAAELRAIPQADDQYGFSSPQFAMVIEQGGRQWRIRVGSRTAPGDQVFLQVVGDEEDFVVDADVLKFLPRSVNDWRDVSLAGTERLMFDRVVLTNAGNVLELRLNPTNRLWRMSVKGWEARADSAKVGEALRQLLISRVEKFVTDDPKADLDAFGLQTPDLSLAFVHGTNTALSFDFGKSPTNDAAQIFVRRNAQPSVLYVAKAALEPWRTAIETFRDRHLVTLTAPLDEIEVHGQDDFSLRRQKDGWTIAPQNFPVDTAFVTNFIAQLGRLQVAQIVKEVVTAPDLAPKGLASPARQFILKTRVTTAAAEATNQVLVQLDFGTNQDDLTFVRRADESSVYAIKLSDFQNLPAASWEFRERQIWKFTENDVAQITIHHAGKVREILRHGTNSWSLAPGSQGMINDLALDEVAHQLGELYAAAWAARGAAHREPLGFTPRSQRISVKLADGRQLALEMGGTAPSGLPLAAVTLDGDTWFFEMPLGIYQFVALYLTIPPDVP